MSSQMNSSHSYDETEYEIETAKRHCTGAKSVDGCNLNPRVTHLLKRANRLHHKLKKLQMCQLSRQVSASLQLQSQKKENREFDRWIENGASLQIDFDSDATDSDCSSECLSDSDFVLSDLRANALKAADSVANGMQNGVRNDERSAEKEKVEKVFAEKTGNVWAKWQWLLFQVHSLEFKILQTNELLRRIRKEEPRAEVEQPPLLLSPDGTTDRTESAARVRAVVGVKRKRMGCTLSITAQSHNTLQPVPVPCACAPNTCCIVCGGPGTLYVAEPDRSLHTVDERVAMLFPRQHHVLGRGKRPLSAQYGRLIKDKKCSSFHTTQSIQNSLHNQNAAKKNMQQPHNQKVSDKYCLGGVKIGEKGKSSELVTGKEKAKVKTPTGGSSNHLQMLLQSKKRSRQAMKNKSSGFKKEHNVKSNEKPDASGVSCVEVKKSAANGQVTAAAEWGLSESEKDRPYMPDLSESSSSSGSESDSSSENEASGARTWNPSPSKVQKLQQQQNKKQFKQKDKERVKERKGSGTSIESGNSERKVVAAIATSQLSKQSTCSSSETPSMSSAKKTSGQTGSVNCDSSDAREEIVIPLSNSLPLFEPVMYKTIETPQWRTKWFEPLPQKMAGLEDMSAPHYAQMHSRYEQEERVKIAGLQQSKANNADQPSSSSAVVLGTFSSAARRGGGGDKDNRREEEEEFSSFERRDFPLTQRQLLDVNKTMNTRHSQDFFEVL